MSTTLLPLRPETLDRPEQPTSTPRRRDPWFDNAKMLLVTLVVVGHSWTLLPDHLARHWFYDFLYLWHVPAFVMVTGYLSRSFTWSRAHLTRLVTTVAVPYVLFEAGLAAFRYAVGGEELDRLFVDPHWPMWYLAVLFLWRLATPALRGPGALPFAVAVSLLGGLTTGDVLDTARAMGLLPFFVLGLNARPEYLDLLRRPAVRRRASAVLASAFLLAPLVEGHLRTEWLYWRSSYAELDASFAEGVAIRAGLLVLTAVLALAFLSLVPRSPGWFSRLGAATLVVYLVHGFFVKTAEYAGAPAWTASHPWLGLVLTTTAAVVLALTLAAPPVARRLGVAVDPVGAYRRRAAARSHAVGDRTPSDRAA